MKENQTLFFLCFTAACDDWVDKGGGELQVQVKQVQQGHPPSVQYVYVSSY